MFVLIRREAIHHYQVVKFLYGCEKRVRMGKKIDVLVNILFVGSLIAGGGYVVGRLAQKRLDTYKEKAPQQEMAKPVQQPVAQVVAPVDKPLEQIVVDEKTGLAVVQPRDSIQFYGERVLQGGKYRSVDKELYELLVKMADAYKVEFNQKLFVGPMWDDKGHTNGSKHYQGLAIDVDFGADVGTEAYKHDRKKAEFLLRYVQKYSKENNKKFTVLFNDLEFVREDLCKDYPGHHNHIHIGK